MHSSLSIGIPIVAPIFFTICILVIGFLCYFVYLCIKALRKYIKTTSIRKEKAETAKTLGEVLKEYRIKCNMTQEFVAEQLGVSRQAVSKWEKGTSDPCTSNLMALSRLYDVPAEEILKKI